MRFLVNNRAKPVEPVELVKIGCQISIRHFFGPPGAKFLVGAPHGLVSALAS